MKVLKHMYGIYVYKDVTYVYVKYVCINTNINIYIYICKYTCIFTKQTSIKPCPNGSQVAGAEISENVATLAGLVLSPSSPSSSISSSG